MVEYGRIIKTSWKISSFAIDVSGDEILHVFDVRFQNVAGDIETENVDDSFVRRDDFTNFFIDETILELFSRRRIPLKQ